MAKKEKACVDCKIIFEGDKNDLENTKDERVIQFIKGSSSGPIKEMEV